MPLMKACQSESKFQLKYINCLSNAANQEHIMAKMLNDIAIPWESTASEHLSWHPNRRNTKANSFMLSEFIIMLFQEQVHC